MTFLPPHTGLVFGPANIEQAQSHHKQDALALAWAWLEAENGAVIGERKAPTLENKRATMPIIKPTLIGLTDVLAQATRYRFLDDQAAGSKAIQAVRGQLGFADTDHLTTTLAQTVTLAQIIEMLRTHREWTFDTQWQAAFRERAHALLSVESSLHIHRLWQTTLRMAYAIVLEDEVFFDAACNEFHTALQDIHPEGYLKSVVEGKDLDTFTRQLQGACAMAMTAEMATQQSVDLWAAQHRGVSVGTAVSYVVYYYFFPDKWKWTSDLTADFIQPLMTDWGGIMELAYRRVPLLRGVETLLDECRPFFSVYGGGLTTLSHGAILPPPKKRGLFG